MRLTRRDFLKVASCTGVMAALPLAVVEKALAGNGDPRVIWLQGQSCSGCSVSLLNSVKTTTIDDILLNTINLEYHSTLIVAAGDLALSGAFGSHPNVSELAAFSHEWLAEGENLTFDYSGDGRVNLADFNKLCNQGFTLVVEGSIPTGADGLYCEIGGHVTMEEAFTTLSQKADQIVAVGACACYGGIPGANPNPTGAKSAGQMLTQLGLSKPLINIPGCPVHPNWFVETLIKVLAGQSITLDSKGRPSDIFGSGENQRIHARCEFRGREEANQLGQSGCLEDLGCKGKRTWANCPVLKWNSPGPNQNGVNWCIGARTPCYGCVEPSFPDGMTPFISEDD